jgi:medium-chain acyl-[acyl-carrier-protein] hydrolase
MIEPIATIQKPSDWIVRLQSVPQPRLRLFCFANAGGSVAQFRNWHQSLPSGVEICPVQMPGQGSRLREKPYTRLESLASTLADVLQPQMDVPFAFWGYSMGALIAFELTRELRRRGQALPRHLFIAARRAPHLPATDFPLHNLPESAFIREVQRRYNGIPAAILQEADMLALFLPVLRANFEMIETYTYETSDPLPCPITAFGGLQDPTVNAGQIGAWREHTGTAFKYRLFPGDHFFLQQHQAAVLEIVSQDMISFL